MKNLYLLFLLPILILTGCKSSAEKKAAKEKATLDSLLVAMKVEKEVDSLMKTAANKVDEKNAQLIPISIAIQNFYTSKPNSAGGVDCNIIWKNKSDKIVKYAKFTVTPYNAVDDMVESSIGGDTYKKLKATGPVKTGEVDGYGTTWECIWYNSTISYMKITGIELEYMDGTIISTNKAEIIAQVLPKR